MVQRAIDMGVKRPEEHGSKTHQSTGQQDTLVTGSSFLKGLIIQGAAGSDPGCVIYSALKPGRRKRYDGGLDNNVYGNGIMKAINFYGAKMGAGITVRSTNASNWLFVQENVDFK